MIRYRTGDIGAFSRDVCQCGSFLRTMKKVDGRLKNRIQLGGNVIFDLKELEEILLADEDLIDYQVTIKDDQTLLIEVSFYQNETEKEAQLQRRVQAHFFKSHGALKQIEVARSPLQKPDQLVNSMVKRKIRDWRKEISSE